MQLFKLNGRAGNDKNVGKLTCRNASVVDCCICSPELLLSVHNFDVLDMSKLYSNVYLPVIVKFKIDIENIIHENRNPESNGTVTQKIKP